MEGNSSPSNDRGKPAAAVSNATMREAFSKAVEEAVSRKVIGFLSQVHINPDLSIETFILEPDHTGEADG